LLCCYAEYNIICDFCICANKYVAPFITSLQTHPTKPNQTNQNINTYTASVSDYQEVFQQMKQQHPNTSLGALQQITMQRIAELKLQKKKREEEELRRIQQQQQQHNDHHHKNNSNEVGGGRMTLLGGMGSLFMRHRTDSCEFDGSDRNINNNNNSDRSDRSDHRDNNNSNNNHLPKAPFMVDDSFRSNNSGEYDNNNDTTTPSSRNVLSRATILISRRTSNDDSNHNGNSHHHHHSRRSTVESSRRSSMESNPLSMTSEVDTSDKNNNNNSNNNELHNSFISIHAHNMMGEDQKMNFAPRKSVGDLTALGDSLLSSDDYDDYDDDDNRTAATGTRSLMSGLFISGDDSTTVHNSGKLRGSGTSGDGGASADASAEADSNGGASHQQQQQQHQENADENLLVQTQKLSTSTSHQHQPQRSDNSCGVDSYISLLSAASEGSYDAGSLIVGFGRTPPTPQPKSIMSRKNQQHPEEEDESRGFAADFSAWDNR
jgi:hypothetical protein